MIKNKVYKIVDRFKGKSQFNDTDMVKRTEIFVEDLPNSDIRDELEDRESLENARRVDQILKDYDRKIEGKGGDVKSPREKDKEKEKEKEKYMHISEISEEPENSAASNFEDTDGE